MANIKIRPLTIGLLVLAAVLIVVGVIYMTNTAANLPAFFPGHLAHSPHHHTKHGLAAFTLAIVVLIAAWFTTSPERPTAN
jgi:amino acid permease